MDGSGSDTNVITVKLPAQVNFQYDANGNLTSDGRRAFTFDDENQLTVVEVAGVSRSEFTYDGRMRRRLRKEYRWETSGWVLDQEVRYVYDGMLVVQERDGSNSPTTSYTRGTDLSGQTGSALDGAGGIGGLLAMTVEDDLPAGSAHALYHADGNGNITALIGTNGSVLARYAYDPYGNTLTMSGPKADANIFRFSSKPIHRPSGMYDYAYRWYAPELQRWPNRDPIGEQGGLNVYRFVENTPSSAYDSFGLASKKCCPPGSDFTEQRSFASCFAATFGWHLSNCTSPIWPVLCGVIALSCFELPFGGPGPCHFGPNPACVACLLAAGTTCAIPISKSLGVAAGWCSSIGGRCNQMTECP
jgi:RHS repeat-associated protein